MSAWRTMVACGAVSAVIGGGTAALVSASGGDDAVRVSSPVYGCMDVARGSLHLSDASSDCEAGRVPVTWQGADGSAGADGQDGRDGEDGDSGADGQAGATGARGERGAAGDDGADGAPGVDGADGADGVDGRDGAAGPAGAKGDTGAAGAKGDQGEKGDAGAAGAKGDQGEKGDAGATGAKGDQGEKGDAGATGAKGDQGEKGDTGATGATGAKGEKGEQGDDGLVPWSAVSAWSASVTYSAGPPASVVTRGGSTYVAARSSVAADPVASPADWILVAAAGVQGEKGEKGDKGDDGAAGATGATGLTGATGATGATGPAGPEGPAGPQGPMGPQGPAGNSLLSGQFNQYQGSMRQFRSPIDCALGTITLSVGAMGMPADGRALSLQQNTALYSLYGTTFGGDGRTYFNVPDLRPVTPNGLRYGICTEGYYPSLE
ncbi:tail fiber protein [Aeromicrobium sp. 179-A 4D2 NHS]|uniref:tail fiber protein n=1 Tax=Aeromicrobium sp. 179-A 4D2 NHS TaxID=3142375 RepID=UPI0039A0DC76